MTWWEAIVLGLVQGLTEFLPISSSAHIRIVGELLPNSGDPGAAFTAITQIGTEAAVLLYFRKDIARIVSAWFRALPIGPWRNEVPGTDPDARMGWFIIWGSLPIGVLGLMLQDVIDTNFRNLYLIAFTLAAFGLLLGWADVRGRQVKSLADMTVRDSVIFGFAQAMALIPGVSRSGGTITAGRLMGYRRPDAARYSFLLAIPAVLASGLYKLLKDVVLADPDTLAAGPPVAGTALATLVAFVVGYAVIVWFLKFISTESFVPFVVYRVLLALAVVALVATGVLSAMPAGPAGGALG